MKFELNDKIAAAIHHDKGGLAAVLLAFAALWVFALLGVSMI